MTFNLSELEAQQLYVKEFLSSDIKYARLGAAILLTPILIFSLNDYTLFGFSIEFLTILLIRIGLFSLTVFLTVFLIRIKDYDQFYKVITIWEILLVFCLAAINLTRPAYFVPDQAIISVIFIFILNMVIPNRLPYKAILAFIIAISIPITVDLNDVGLTALVSLLVAYILSILISWQIDNYRKRNFENILNTKQAELNLRNSEQRFKDLVETTSDWIWQVNQNAQYTYVSPKIKEILGYDPDEIIGKTPFDLMPEKEAENVSKEFKKFLENKEPFSGLENWNMHKNGTLVLFESSGVPIKNEKNEIVGYRGIDRDITQRKRIEEQLASYRRKLEEHAQKLEALVEDRTKQLKDSERMAAIGQTAGMIGHDIRNPLQAIVSELFMAKETMNDTPPSSGTEEAIKSITFIEQQVEYISKIVSDLQDYARPLKPEMVLVKICSFIKEATATIEIPQNIDATLLCNEKQESTVILDKILMTRALANLVNNAVQAMPDGGKLTIQVSQNDQYVKIIVEDTGIGIPEEIKSKIFTPLFTTKAKGQGFGLAVVKRLIEAQDGTIRFESELGKGTKFIINLPLSK